MNLYEYGKPKTTIVGVYNFTPSTLDRWTKQAQSTGSFKEKDNRQQQKNLMMNSYVQLLLSFMKVEKCVVLEK
ncbi:hypothetical protein ACFSTH_14525 [Paenibacillus yanchengensis]